MDYLMIYCPECGNKTPAQKFCVNCGTSLEWIKKLDSITERAKIDEDDVKRDTLINNRYKIVTFIGKGGMGVVYKAIDTVLNRSVALKFMENNKLKERFLRESEIMASLNHPNIVTVYDRGEYKKSAYIVMEFIEGETVENRFKTRGLSFSESLNILKEVSIGLQYIHSKGITHRDIKTGNVMITPFKGIKIMDFGISKDPEKSELTTEGSPILGTPSYMAPEFFLGHKIDQRSDIYSLGIMAYKLFTGRLPFWQGDVRYQQIYINPILPRKINPNIPFKIESIILKCLEKDPEKRYQTATSLIKDLDESLSIIKTNVIKSGKAQVRKSSSKIELEKILSKEKVKIFNIGRLGEEGNNLYWFTFYMLLGIFVIIISFILFFTSK